MKTKSKALLLALCAVLLVAASVLGTLAYLTSQDQVTNTFTVGSVSITLDEAKVNTDGTYVNEHNTRVKANEYHLLPGHTYYKDPTVTVDAKSEAAYVRMVVTVENIDQLKLALPNSGATAKYYGADGTFLLQMLCVDENGTCTWDKDIWKMQGYTESTDGKNGVYEFRYKAIVAKGNDSHTTGYVTVKETVVKAGTTTAGTVEMPAANAQPQLIFTAYAVQKANRTVDEASPLRIRPRPRWKTR